MRLRRNFRAEHPESKRKRRIALPWLPGLLIAMATAVPGGADPPDVFQPQFMPTLEIHPAGGPIRIDGNLDDPGWQGAVRADGFAEVSPGDQVAPPVESETWVTYDEENLYLALVAHDDPATVRVSLSERDQIWHDDYFGLMLDTYGDHNWGYEFFVNPLGIQGDLRMHSGGAEDLSYDLIWYSRGQVTDDGYQVELAIPFASLRFPRREVQSWRVNFWRDHQREVRRQYAWAATDRDEPCWMCQWGTLTGICGINPPRNLEVIGSAIGTQTGERREDASGEGKLHYYDPEGEASASLRYSLTSTSSAELTINPDFSQIESDAGQIDINEPFTIFYDEKRPFFLEGSELYRTWMQVVYTRSISNPLVAGKVLGSHGRTALAWTFAQDEDSPVILPLEERSFFRTAGKSRVNLLRIQHAFGTDSHVGGIMTDRRLDEGGSGTLGGLDGAVRFLHSWRARAQILASHTHEPNDSSITAGPPGTTNLMELTFDRGRHTLGFDGERFDGHAILAALDRSGRYWNGEIDFEERHPSFRADNGFITRNDYRMLSTWNGLMFQPDGKVVVSWEPSLMLARMWDYSGRFQDEWIMAGIEGQFKQQTNLEIEGLVSRERFREKIIPGIRRATFSASTRPSETIGVGVELEVGRSIYRTFDPEVEPFLGRIVNVEMEANLKLLTRLALSTVLSYARMKEPDGETLVYDGWILRNRLDYQVNREASVRIVTEYDNFDERFAFEPLLTYRLNAFSVFYLGMSDEYLRFGEEPEVGHGPRPQWDLGGRQIFAKLQYLFRV
jgi:hypothetical protein